LVKRYATSKKLTARFIVTIVAATLLTSCSNNDHAEAVDDGTNQVCAAAFGVRDTLTELLSDPEAPHGHNLVDHLLGYLPQGARLNAFDGRVVVTGLKLRTFTLPL
jgi:hypothetical protein